MKFYASVRMEVRRMDYLKQGSENIGNRVKVKVVKNKLAPPFKTAEFDILFGKGISREGGLIDMGIETGIINKSGAWMSFGDVRWNGRDKARKELEDNPQLADELEKLIRQSIIAPSAEENAEMPEEEY